MGPRHAFDATVLDSGAIMMTMKLESNNDGLDDRDEEIKDTDSNDGESNDGDCAAREMYTEADVADAVVAEVLAREVLQAFH